MVDAGFLLVDKPEAWTSHDVVAKVRRLAGIRKVGHAGTLDPMATGLLVLGMQRATRLLRFVQGHRKVYEATMVMGVGTDTLDATGAVLEREPMEVEEDDLAGVTTRFIGNIAQVPPMVSAIKVGGRRLYEVAREGGEVEREARMVEIHSIDVLDFAPGPYPEAVIRVECGSGTYIRTLADDLAGALGGRAHLSALRRLSNGSLTVEAAHTIEALEQAADDERLDSLVLSASQGLCDLPAVTLDADRARAALTGSVFTSAALGGGSGPHRILDEEGALLAVYDLGEARAKPEVVLS